MTRGRLTQWDDAKGYGFITPDDGTPRLFVHIQAFGPRPQRPFVGERLGYREGRDAQGKRRAQHVRSLEPRPMSPMPKARDHGRVLLLVPGFAAFVLACHLLWGVPNPVWGVYSAMSMATFIVYALDKRAARLGGWRVAENTLHGLALLCGWPGALLAQELLRHKSAKPAFRRLFWLTVVLNVLGFALLFTPLREWAVRRPF
ncbi:cold shock and DUF1294 domain-containing protein [Pelomonas aquatica]|jgi:uncharacterized membrane protein YsdA (DUF1294 family)/cold shock CspA family protein|uniref:DUF1294 domain-containing protein n=1 Tax=Pelomonas aquatica TaxID=431058 RepID=A0A9X4R350_9BURK|nr:cold shock and DUF1294 domain-containing protein [Pelomonas aquatica]MCY4755079.1 cold shock and DUF1294 domain-containing protein [Pelomonas aquatica]MDG0860906.1 DUF1294 domain-containing protein [Pelomonas aquatica]